MNAFKKTGGFTLVELIIVIAILAILSSVAVAGYSSYITKANDSAVESWAGNVKTHATLANAQTGAITSVQFTYIAADDDVTVIISAEAFDDEFATDFVKAFPGVTLKAYKADGTTAAANLAETKVYKFTTDAVSAWKGSQYKTASASQIPSDN